MQNHFDLADKSKNDEIKLQKCGIINAHLCVNVETKLSHTENDSSYTTICVPSYHIDKIPSGIYNKVKFELNIKDNEAIMESFCMEIKEDSRRKQIYIIIKVLLLRNSLLLKISLLLYIVHLYVQFL